MSRTVSQVVGIDLGTTNSVVASVDNDGTVVVLPNANGGEITPSVVYFEPDGTAVVGEEAVQATAVDPENGVQLIKRAMGTEFPLRIRGQEHSPESVSALILRQLVIAANGSQDKVSAVITVPAYFGHAEREATYQAGVIAGLNVLELLDEPVAAAAHYGLTSSADRAVLVYDLGGGTFDTTVLRISGGAVQVLATDGHHSLGGADVDQRLIDLILERLGDRLLPDELDDIVDDKKRLAELVLDAEAAKKDLSARTSRQVIVRTPAGRTSVTITRADLDATCGDLFDTTAEIIERVLRTAGLEGGRDIDDVIMVGGSSRIPMLAARLKAMLGKVPRLIDPDLAVAKGAALRAHHLAGTPQLTALTTVRGRVGGGSRGTGQVTPVAPRAVGILVEDSFDPSGKRSFVEHLIAANTPLPVRRIEERFGTILEKQESVRIQVYEQAGPAPSPEVGHNRRVLDGELTQLGSLAAGSLIRITIRIAIDGRLTVIAHEPESGRELRLEAYVEGVVDGSETERLTRLVGLTKVRG
ncbi:MAG: Hsp70 family protein [Streptosporangiaceae bacterium]|nr:Hsp70 family protein [Streptosporangiaceae bacterium]